MSAAAERASRIEWKRTVADLLLRCICVVCAACVAYQACIRSVVCAACVRSFEERETLACASACQPGGWGAWGTDINELNGAITGKGAADVGPLRCCIQLCYPHLLHLYEALSYERVRP